MSTNDRDSFLSNIGDDPLPDNADELLRQESPLPPADGDVTATANPAAIPDTAPDGEGQPDPQGQTGQTGQPNQPNQQGQQTQSEPKASSFEEFAKMHAGKSPEEILKLAYNQSNARIEARREAKDAREETRQTAELLQKVQTRISEAFQNKQKEIQEKREAFQARLNADPDAATQELHDRLLREEEEAAQQQARTEWVETQRRVLHSIIPDFDQRNDTIVRFANGVMGYTPDELKGAVDYRDLVTLDMAERFYSAVNRGLITFDGQPGPALSQMQGQTAQNGQGQQAQPPQNPALSRVAKAAGHQNSQVPRGQAPGAGNSPSDKAQALLAMSDDDLMRMDSRELERLMRELSN